MTEAEKLKLKDIYKRLYINNSERINEYDTDVTDEEHKWVMKMNGLHPNETEQLHKSVRLEISEMLRNREKKFFIWDTVMQAVILFIPFYLLVYFEIYSFVSIIIVTLLVFILLGVILPVGMSKLYRWLYSDRY